MKVLVVDIGGTNVKVLASGQDTRRKFPSGPSLEPQQLVSGVKDLTKDWQYDVVTIGYPGLIRGGRVASEARNLGPGWIGTDFERAFGRPVKLINDAAMQALGSYQGGTLLFVGLGTGLGAALVSDGVIVPMEWGRLGYRKKTYEDFVGRRGMKRFSKKRWQKHVEFGVARLIAAFRPDDVVIGGGNAKKLLALPSGCRLGDNSNAFIGGFRLWDDAGSVSAPSS